MSGLWCRSPCAPCCSGRRLDQLFPCVARTGPTTAVSRNFVAKESRRRWRRFTAAPEAATGSAQPSTADSSEGDLAEAVADDDQLEVLEEDARAWADFDAGQEENSPSASGLQVAPGTGPEDAAADAASRALAVALARVAWDTKGDDVTVLHVAPLVFWTSYMVLVTVFSRPQLQAVLGKMEAEARDAFDRRLQGTTSPGRSVWEILDFGDVVVHVFTPDHREYYDLESFYGAAEEVDLPFLTREAGGIEWANKL